MKTDLHDVAATYSKPGAAFFVAVGADDDDLVQYAIPVSECTILCDVIADRVDAAADDGVVQYAL